MKMLQCCCVLLACLSACSQSLLRAEEFHADIIVYGGTSAGVVASLQAKRMGKSSILVCPETHLGGLSSGGLGFTDTGNKAVIGGIAREFYHKIWEHYQQPDAWNWQPATEYGNKGQGTPAIDGNQRTMWIFEPHVAESVFESFVRDNDLIVHRNQWLNRKDGIVKQRNRIVSIRTLAGDTYFGKTFIDASYEGDLMAAAGVSYHVGRESTETYNEQWAGVQTGVLHHGHHFGKMNISPFIVPNDPSSGLLPLISNAPPGEYGSGDRRIQAYCFRLCLTNHAPNRVEFVKPVNYDPHTYRLLSRVFATGWRETFNKFDPIPNYKTDVNNHGPVSMDFIGANNDYPEASYQRRKEIIQEHRQYQLGLLYYLAHDPEVPEEVRTEMLRWGFAKDEFVDNDHWPHQIYVREARRMLGSFVMTENELLGKRETPDSVGMGSYTIDSHNVQRYITPEGYVQNEGDIGVHTPGPYKIAFGSILPKQDECGNLVVPVCVSSSHIAFGSIRMEPVFMILAQSAATTVALAINEQVDVQQIAYETLRTQLLKDGQILDHGDSLKRNEIQP